MMLVSPLVLIEAYISRLIQMLLPSLSPEFQKRHEDYIREGQEVAAKLSMRRASTLLKIEEINEGIDAFSNPEMADANQDLKPPSITDADQLPKFCELVEKHQLLKSYLDSLDDQISIVNEKYGTAASRDATGYQGIQDWAKRKLEKYSHFCDSISAASVFGAGITYTTIFNAPSASVSLIAWSFSLFDIAFIISVCVRTILMWSSRLPLLKRTFASTFWWDWAISIALGLAFTSGAAAICILNITVLNLATTGTQPMPHGQDSDASSASSPISRNSLLPSVSLSIISLAGALMTAVILMLLSWWATDFNRERETDDRLTSTNDYFV